MRKRFRTSYIELTNQCNKNCSFCHGTSRPPGFMETSMFSSLSLELKPLAELIYLHVMGEALLHPDFDEIIRIATHAALPLGLTTNGTLFHLHAAENLENPIFQRLNISLHSGTTPKGIREIVDFCESILKINPVLRINYRFWNVCRDNRETLEYLQTYYKVRWEPQEKENNFFHALTDRVAIHFAQAFEWPDLSASSENKNPVGYCHGGIDQFAVLYDGSVTACCLDSEGACCFGRYPEKKLLDILQSQRMERMRNSFFRGMISEALCRHCTYRERFQMRAEELYVKYKIKNRFQS